MVLREYARMAACPRGAGTTSTPTLILNRERSQARKALLL